MSNRISEPENEGEEMTVTKFLLFMTVCLSFSVCVSLTKAMTHYRNFPPELWVSLFKSSVQSVDLRGYCVHYGLAVGWTIIEEQVQQSVVSEMSQSTDAGQSDPLDIPGK